MAARNRCDIALRHSAAMSSGDHMLTLARFGFGRILLHLVAMLGALRFHAAGIMRELACGRGR
jgi:hypothetical protein